ncbi:MAG TPA: hypothetical protein RMH99_14500 [Sandaracinaceae bacterium LLY-WYZ-13_1]|nr:hypothetical protein [Sandaracinaceae bacterium LLY-WYZ-13_1]
MSSGPLRVPGAKATLVLSMALSVLGFAGVMWSAGLLGYTPGDVSATEGASWPGADPEAAAAYLDLLVASDLQRGLTVANLILSGLLVVASFLLMLRRSSSLWWTRQALFGNLIYTVAAMAGSIWFHHQHRAALSELAAQMAVNAGAPPEGAPSPLGFAAKDICFGVILIGAYVLLVRLTRRPSVRDFVGHSEAGS